MSEESVSSDVAVLDLLRKRDSMTVSQLAEAMQVTATAVRQRLNRLLAHGLIERTAAKSGRGRPSHRYVLTNKGRRRAGTNSADLAIVLWQEIREIRDPEVRGGLLRRISRRLAGMYADRVNGSSLAERMGELAELFRERRIPFEVDHSGELPVLNVLACPYPDLADRDRSTCAMERMLFSDLLGESVHLTRCRLDGDRCCTFQPT